MRATWALGAGVRSVEPDKLRRISPEVTPAKSLGPRRAQEVLSKHHSCSLLGRKPGRASGRRSGSGPKARGAAS